ncbi:hypothetical protein D9M72_612150 [compost metagenome]
MAHSAVGRISTSLYPSIAVKVVSMHVISREPTATTRTWRITKFASCPNQASVKRRVAWNMASATKIGPIASTMASASRA